MVNKPLIRPYFWGGYVRGGVVLGCVFCAFFPGIKTTTGWPWDESARCDCDHQEDQICCLLRFSSRFILYFP